MTSSNDPFKARASLATPLGPKTIFRLDALKSLGSIDRLPYSIKVLLESCLRNLDGFIVTEENIRALAKYNAKNVGDVEIPFMPGRVVLQDFTGVPCVVDLAAMRAAMARMGGDPLKVNPLVPCDLVIDHSVQVDAFGTAQALTINNRLDFERNTERYQFLKYGQKAFNNFRVVPPATGIVHQVNLEYLAKVVWEKNTAGSQGVLYPDSLVGTDSHTTMINGLGVVGWGVGGIEAEAVMLGQPIYMLIPEVVGLKLTGKLNEGTTATDLVLTVTQLLRKHGVVNKFVEFHGPGLATMPLANRATIANMAPEYGATIGFFPVDDQTLSYLRLSGRDEKLIATVEQYCKEQGLWRNDAYPIEYSSTLELDLGSVEPSLAGPKRPQDRIALSAMQDAWNRELGTSYGKRAIPNKTNGAAISREISEGGIATAVTDTDSGVAQVESDGVTFKLKHGDVVIAAITSCTNTSNPEVMLGAGIVAKKARALGLTRKPWVKTSLTPGSKVVTDYYEKAGLTQSLNELGFFLAGYGCGTCIGNSGPLPEAISKAINAYDLVVCSVLSGNRNFEGRVHPDVKANYLASPPLVVAYAIAGTVDIDLATDPLGHDSAGRAIYLKDIWPTQAEIADAVAKCVTREQFIAQYSNVFEGPAEWKAISAPTGALFKWEEKSTYIQEPPFFENLAPTPSPISAIRGARCLALLGDSVTTDHISPAGNIKKDSPAGKYLQANNVPVALFNSYGARRGNDRVMTRGTFANTRIKNRLAPGTEGGVTTYLGDPRTHAGQTGSIAVGTVVPIYDAAMAYKAAGVPLVVIGGKDYGMGSSRDWAAKGTFLLGVRAVIAESFERIHRSNLVGMGVLPLTFKPGQTAATLGLTGQETFDIDINDSVHPKQDIKVQLTRPDGTTAEFVVICRIDTPVEVGYYRNGGILQTVIRKMAGN
ncbi:MAG: aconitate hydratase AcnA [Phycisphaeraceae bacterium]|nr:aconitate hydratase AcnA [Phycisphaeraceae bacterium]